MQPGGKRWSSSVSPEPLGMHLGSLAGFLPCPIFCWCLLREKHSVLFLRHLECREGEVPGQVTMQRKSWVSELPWERCYPCWNRHVLNLFAEQKPPVLCVLVDCYRRSHSGMVYMAFCQQLVYSSGFFSPLNHFRELHHRKCKFSGNFTLPDFATSTEQAAAKQIIPSSHVCDFVLLAWHEFDHDVCVCAGSFRCCWGQRSWEGVEEERDLQLLVNQSHLQRRPIAPGNG